MSSKARTRTNVGITSSRRNEDNDKPDRLNSRKFAQTQKTEGEFYRTSLPMHNNRGGQGDRTSARNKWQFQSHNKTLLPTERVSRQTGELPWKAAPPQVYMRAMDPTMQRDGATCFNKYALDKDQDGKLDEAELFYKTTAGEVGKANQTMKAMQFVTMNMSNSESAIEEDPTFDDKVDRVAKQRALVGDILERNNPHIDLFSLNPGKRTTYIKPKYCDANKISSSQKESTEDDTSSQVIGHEHFIPSDPLDQQIDQAMEIMNDPKTYNGNFPLYIRDMYVSENRAKLTGSSQMNRIFAPQRIDGGQSALNPPPNMTSNGTDFSLSSSRPSNNASSLRPNSVPTNTDQMNQTFGSVIGNNFTSAYKISSHYDSDHGERYPGQWHRSKTLSHTSRGVRQKGEPSPIAGGLGKAGSERQGRLTVKRHLGPSRPHTTTGLSSNAGNQGSTCNPDNGPQHVAPKGRWTNPDRGRQLPMLLYDDKTKDGVRPNYFEPNVYCRDLSDNHLRYNSMGSWTHKAKPHEDYCWTRSPGTLLLGRDLPGKR